MGQATFCFALSGRRLIGVETQGGAPTLRLFRLPWAVLLRPFQGVLQRKTKKAGEIESRNDKTRFAWRS